MSTDFRMTDPSKGMGKDALLAALAPHGVREGTPAEPSSAILLTDGDNELRAYSEEDGKVTSFTVYSETSNDVSGIISALKAALGDELLSEHDDGFFEDEDDEDDDIDGENSLYRDDLDD